MAYGLKYYASTRDRMGVNWEVHIYQEGYIPGSADPVEILGRSPMLSLLYEGENEDLFSQEILSSRLEISLMVQDLAFENEINGMLTATETDWRVDLYLVDDTPAPATHHLK